MDSVEIEMANKNPSVDIEQLAESFDTLTFLEPRADFDSCIIGVVQRNNQEPSLCYAYEKVIYALKSIGGISDEEAEEHFSFNIIGAYVGETTPCFLFSG